MYPVNFLPYVGPKYGTNNIFGKKIAVLGESHYSQHTSADMTREVMKFYLNPNTEFEGWMNTFTKFGRSLVNKDVSRGESIEIWESLMFYNYVQEAMTDARVAPTRQQFADSENAFFEVMEEKEPDLLIVWGHRLFNNLPDTNWEDGEELKVEGRIISNGYYKLKTGHIVRVVSVTHPSAAYSPSYWYKVLSLFLNKTEKYNAIGRVGFHNFRKFTDFPMLELGGVNIIVGSNNAGKSTFDKATMIFLEFLKKWVKGNTFSLTFDTPLCHSLGINTFGEAFSHFASENEPLSFRMTVGRYTYEAEFGYVEPSADRTDLNYVKVVDHSDNDSEYFFDYTQSQSRIVLNATLPVFCPSEDSLVMLERYVNSPMCGLSDEDKDKVYSHVDTIKNSIRETTLTENTIAEFSALDAILGENTPSDYDNVRMLKEAISHVVNDEEVEASTLVARNNFSIRASIDSLKVVNATQASYDETSKNAISRRAIEHIGLINLPKNKTFSIYDNDEVSMSVVRYCRASLDERINAFIHKWLGKDGFGIGEGLITNTLHNEAFSVSVKTFDGHIIPMTSLGSGSIHLIALLLRIVYVLHNDGVFNNRILIIEEPEINLHPNMQSKLADFFLDIHETFGTQIIVETHSEYMVRKTQVITARLIFDGEKYTKEVNEDFKVYYFPENGTPYSLNFRNDGHFDRKFGEGFFDEAGRSYHTLTKLERGIR